MQAVRLHVLGDPASLAIEQLPMPSPSDGEALVRVHAAAITRDELEWPEGRLPATPSYELSGVVEQIAGDVEGIDVGDHVYGLTPFDRDGVAAEYAVVPCSALAPKPVTLGHVESSAIPLPALSAWQGLFDHGRLERGQRVLIHGAAGGVGGFAVQLARSRGAHVVATASTGNIDAVKALGADEVIDYTNTPFEDSGAFDVVFDTAGDERLRRSPEVLADGGRLVSVATEPPEGGVFFVVEPNRGQLVELAALADAGSLRPTVEVVYPFSDARAAFELSLAGSRRGKIVLQVAP